MIAAVIATEIVADAVDADAGRKFLFKKTERGSMSGARLSFSNPFAHKITKWYLLQSFLR